MIKKKIAYMVAVSVFGILMVTYSVVTKDVSVGIDYARSMGVGFIVAGAIRTIQYYRLLKNPQKLTQYEIANSEERVVFIANKARSMVFVISIYVEIVVMILLIWMGYANEGGLVAVFAGLQTLGYVVAYRVYNNRY